MKKLIKIVKNIAENFWVRLFFLIGCIAGVFALGGAFSSPSAAGNKIWEIITSVDTVSVILVALFSLIVVSVTKASKKYLEESRKVDDDHHRIVCKYHKHLKRDKITDRSYDEKQGVFMYLDKTADRKLPRKPSGDKYSEEYDRLVLDGIDYEGGRLYFPSVCVFSNSAGDTDIVFADKIDRYALPQFVSENALLLMEAHASSNVKNSVTVRLDDFKFENGKLTLETCRSQYYDMLVTNRCMDYELGGAVSVRRVYEYGDTVSPLDKSKLCNQIGINGLIITSDGHLLVEKRGRKKATWKNKFAQPISLALKITDDIVGKDGLLAGGEAGAEAVFKKVILDTVGKNFGILESDIEEFSLKTNFMGIARDLLEGGKPNLYFYIVTKKAAQEFKSDLKKKALEAARKGRRVRPGEDRLPQLTRDKLDSSFFLIKYKDITVDYNYRLKVKAKKIERVKRKYKPRVCAIKSAFDGLGYRIKRAFGMSIKRECGEAFLSCLYFAGTCPRVYEKYFGEKHERGVPNEK